MLHVPWFLVKLDCEDIAPSLRLEILITVIVSVRGNGEVFRELYQCLCRD